MFLFSGGICNPLGTPEQRTPAGLAELPDRYAISHRNIRTTVHLWLLLFPGGSSDSALKPARSLAVFFRNQLHSEQQQTGGLFRYGNGGLPSAPNVTVAG